MIEEKVKQRFRYKERYYEEETHVPPKRKDKALLLRQNWIESGSGYHGAKERAVYHLID